MSPATYDKLKQASSLFAAKDPKSMRIVHNAYRKLVEMEERISRAQYDILDSNTDEEREQAESELEQLLKHQEAVLRNFDYQMEGKMQEYARRAALQRPQSSNFAPKQAWADMVDSDEEHEEEEDQGFWGGRDPYDEAAVVYLRPGSLIYKCWDSHDPDAEAEDVGEADEARKGHAAAYPETVPGENMVKYSQTESIKKQCIQKLLDIPLSSGNKVHRQLVERIQSKFIANDGTVQSVESDLFTYLMNRLVHTDSIYVKRGDAYHFFDVAPINPGSSDDLAVAHYISDDFKTATEVIVETPPEITEWWHEVCTGERYKGDVGGSEKKESAQLTAGDQKRFSSFYRDYVGQPMDNVLPHRKLVRDPATGSELTASLDKYFSPGGKLSDLHSAINCGVDVLWQRPEADEFRNYLSLGEPIWSSTAKETIPDSNGDPCFRAVGKHTPISGGRPEEGISELSRRVTKILASVGQKHPEAEADLITATTYVMPPTGEKAIVDSLKGQSKKQRIARPSEKLRQYLRYVSFETAKHLPQSRWSYDEFPVGEILSHHIDVAEDKSIGWAGLLYPGTRGNIQKDTLKRNAVIRLTKFRLALRFALANSLHSLSPAEMVRQGLRDPCVAFIKPEGHPVRKRETKSWRVIWVVSELDRLIDASVFTEQDKADIAHYQTGPRASQGRVEQPGDRVYPLSMGIGHDDASLERTFFELETLLASSPDGSIYSSDASGWDFSVSAASFWSALETRLCRARNDLQIATYLINGFFQQAWVVTSGTTLWESYRFGITASGSSITTSSNTHLLPAQRAGTGLAPPDELTWISTPGGYVIPSGLSADQWLKPLYSRISNACRHERLSLAVE